MDHRVSAQVKDFDHYRIHGGVAVETDFIIHVNCVNTGKKTRSEPDFEKFILSKTFSAFRTLVDQLHAAAEAVMSTKKNNKQDNKMDIPIKVKNLANYCETVYQLIESQRTQYLGKVNYMYVKVMAKQRSQIISDVLTTTLSHFPVEIDSHPFLKKVADKIEGFFLTDHAETATEADEMAGGDHIGDHIGALFMTPMKKHYNTVSNPKIIASTRTLPQHNKPSSPDSPDSGIEDNEVPIPVNLNRTVSSPVVPITFKRRRSKAVRTLDEKELTGSGGNASLLLDDDRSETDLVPNYAAPYPTVGSSLGTSQFGTFIDTNPFIFMGIFAVAAQVLRMAGGMVITVDFDIMLLVAFASFCLGLHTPRPMVGGVDKPPLKRPRVRRRASTPTNAAKLLRLSMVGSPRPPKSNRQMSFDDEDIIVEELEGEGEEEEPIFIQSPMLRFPEGAPLGSELNCFSDPDPANFMVRGDKYLTDKKKVKSGPYIFKTRGIDLFLTDDCPENVGRISGIIGGDLRDVPTFLINFRLPWGVLIFYYEIPEKFVPFIKGCYGDKSVEREDLDATITKMNNQDRCTARFLLGNDEHKNKTLKIIPMVVQGPWVVKSVVGGKPAIIGTKMPVDWVYEPESTDADGKKKALYLEADLDIVSSSAARGILSVARTYTQDLTLDLGFAIQGNSADELRECMLVGTRLHGIDPLNAPALPPYGGLFKMSEPDSDGNESV